MQNNSKSRRFKRLAIKIYEPISEQGLCWVPYSQLCYVVSMSRIYRGHWIWSKNIRCESQEYAEDNMLSTILSWMIQYLFVSYLKNSTWLWLFPDILGEKEFWNQTFWPGLNTCSEICWLVDHVFKNQIITLPSEDMCYWYPKTTQPT